MDKRTLQALVSGIVYDTIRTWKNKPKFRTFQLESYDNWKDDIIDRIVEELTPWLKEK